MKENLNESEKEILGCFLQRIVKALYRLTNIDFFTHHKCE